MTFRTCIVVKLGTEVRRVYEVEEQVWYPSGSVSVVLLSMEGEVGDEVGKDGISQIFAILRNLNFILKIQARRSENRDSSNFY